MKKISEYKNPYYWWWKVRKYWKIPKIHLTHIGKMTWWYGLPYPTNYFNKCCSVIISGLGYKDKNGGIRHEWDPFLCFTFFRKWQIIFTWNFCPYFMDKKDPTHNKLSSEQTWETILEMAKNNHTISDACHKVGFWEPYDVCEDSDYYIPTRPITMFRNLTKYGWVKYYTTPRSKQLKT